MKLQRLFAGEYPDYYVRRAFGFTGATTSFGLADIVEVLGTLERRVAVLEDRAEGFYGYVPLLEKLSSVYGTASPLNDVRGLPERAKLELLKRFGSVKRIGDASISELMDVPGVGRVLAKRIKKRLSHGS
jgi:ERCC4-type nuclease